MNANIELALITKIIDERDFRTIEKAKLNEDFFSTPEARIAFNFIRDMYHATATAGCIPSRELLSMHHPTFPFFNSTDNIAVLVEQLRRAKISSDIGLLAQELMNKADVDPIDALATLRARAPALSALSERSEDISLAGAAAELRARYDLVAESRGVIGIPYPWDPLNEATQGMREGNFVLIYGRPKSMKTWVALKIAVNAYVACRRRVLFYSREMEPMEILERAATIIAKVSYEQYFHGKLQPQVRDHVFSILSDLIEDERNAGSIDHRAPCFITISDRDSSSGGGGVSWLRAKIEEHDPDIAFVDGMYLMSDDRSKSRAIDWKNVTHISQDLKQCARQSGIPIIGITQANRGAEGKTGEDLTELAFADSLGMDADAIFRITKHVKIDEASKRKVTELLVTAAGLRTGTFDGMVLEANPGHTFDLIRVLTGVDRNERDPNYKESAGPQRPNGPPRLQARPQFTRDGRLRDPKLPNVP